MSYTKPAQAPFQANLDPSEFVVQLDSGDFVAIKAIMSVEPNTGNANCEVASRVVNADGTSKLDALGQLIQSGWSHTTNSTELQNLGSIQTLQQQCMLAVLGEPTTVWNDPIHATTLQTVSIRTSIASAAHAGPVSTIGEIL